MNKRIAHGAGASVLYTVITISIGFVQLPIILSSLQPTMAGLWLLYLTIGSYASWFDLGITPTIGREISFAMGDPGVTSKERNRRIAELISTMSHVIRPLGICVGIVCFASGAWVIWSSSQFGSDPAVLWAWGAFSIGISLNLLASTAFAGLFGLGEIASEKMIRSSGALLSFILTVTTLKFGWGIVGLSLAWLMQAAVSSVLAWLIFRQRRTQPWPASPQPNWSLGRRLAIPSLKLAAIQLAAILILQSSNPLIALMLGTEAIPSYEAVSKIASTLMTLGLLLVTASSPFFSMAYAAGDSAGVTQLLMRNLRLGVGLMVTLCAFTAVNGDHIVAIWLGPNMFPGFEVLWALLVMVLLEVHHAIFATAVMAAGRIVFVRVVFISAALNIGLAVILTERLGLLGVAIAVTTSQLLTNNWYVPYFAIRFFKITIADLACRFWAPVSALLAAQLSLDFILRQVPWLGKTTASSLATLFLLSGMAGIVLWWRLLLPDSDRRHIYNWLILRRKAPLD